MGIQLHPTDKTIAVEGQMHPVMKSNTGRLFVRVYEEDGNGHREWHAMSMDLLKQRIEATERIKM